MKMKNTAFCILSICFLTNCKPAEKELINDSINKFSDNKIVRIHELKDHRETDSLLHYLNAKSTKYRNEAALALASVGDSNAVQKLTEAYLKIDNYSEEQLYSQKLIALALFQSYGRLGFKNMTILTEKAIDNQVREEILALIGKSGALNEKMMESLSTLSEKNRSDAAYKIGMLKGFYELCARKYYKLEMLQIALELAKKGENPQQRQLAAAYLARLNRIKDINLENAFINPSSTLKNDLFLLIKEEDDPLVKMNLALALGLFESPDKTKLILSELKKENDYRVTVNLLNAATPYDYDTLKEMASTFIGNSNNHIEMAAANFFLKNGQAENLDFYKNMLEKCAFWRAKNIILSALLNAQKNQFTPDTEYFITKALLTAQNEFDASEMYQLLAVNQDWAPILLEFYKKEASETAKTSCLDALGKIASTYIYKDLNLIVSRIQKHLVRAISANDGFRVYTAALYLQNSAFQFQNEDSILLAVNTALAKWPIPKYFETSLELEKLKRKLNNEAFEDFTLENPYNNPIDWSYVRQFSPNQKLKIQTNKGDIIIELDVENAPATVSYIGKLAQNSFYDNLIWHRVVSNFVIQGGDPEGNGTGGSDGSLRSEHSFNSYKEGTVGIASAGKDTESCQFFITHNPTPNLNGRYTIIGYVVEGMDVVHKIQVNDKIIKVELL